MAHELKSNKLYAYVEISNFPSCCGMYIAHNFAAYNKKNLHSPLNEEEKEEITKWIKNYFSLFNAHICVIVVRDELENGIGLPLRDMYSILRNMAVSSHEFYNQNSGNYCEMLVIRPDNVYADRETHEHDKEKDYDD